MDANGLDFWMLSEAADWLPPAGSDTLYYCPVNKRLQLRSRRTGAPPTEDFATASLFIETAPMTQDQFGNYARWDSVAAHVVAGGSGVGEVVIYTPPAGQAVIDLAMGFDGILYIAVAGTLVYVDRRNRWENFTLSAAGFSFWRLLALAEGGVLALDRDNAQLGKVTGSPLQVEPSDMPDPGIMRPCANNSNPPQIRKLLALPSSEKWIAFTALDSSQTAGRIGLLSWASPLNTNKAAFIRVYDEAKGVSQPWTLSETVFPYGLASLGNERLAILATGINEALVYDLKGATTTLTPAGDTYTLAGVDSGPFVHGFGQPVYYSRAAAMFPLLPLSLNSLARTGATDPAKPRVIDSGSSQTTWHRLFVEAILPPRCGLLVWLASSNNSADFTGSSLTWYPHVFGAPDTSSLPPETPRAAWLSGTSEVAFAKPLLGVDPVKDRQGLFMVLIQRVGKAVRNLTGRYLGIRIQLNGDRRTTPQVAALRVYGSRFSYVSHYLPEPYRENKFGPDADQTGESTRRDFFERFVNIFEGQMTRIEDRVANSYLLTRPEATPDGALDWLGGWIGVDPSGYPPDLRRARLLAAPAQFRQRGTVAGITAALDTATNGMCSRGAILVLEDFRLRHIFATILGANLAITNHPLLPGYSGNSNSFVGPALFLGDPRNPDFLTEFAANVALPGEEVQVEQFLDSLAYRMTVFIHNQVEAVDINLVGRIVEYEKPAHIAASIQTATQPFMIGLASLLGTNSYLAPQSTANPAVVDVSQVGRYNTIQHVPALDPRWENGVPNVA